MKKLLVELSDDLHDKLKWYALKTGRSIKDIVIELLERLKDYRK